VHVGRIGGVTGWLRAAPVAEAAGLRLSSHTFPEFSVQLLAAAPNADLLEWLDSAEPVVTTPLVLEHGQISPPVSPGTGLECDAEKLARYAVV
jgi:mandelate racemase